MTRLVIAILLATTFSTGTIRAADCDCAGKSVRERAQCMKFCRSENVGPARGGTALAPKAPDHGS